MFIVRFTQKQVWSFCANEYCAMKRIDGEGLKPKRGRKSRRKQWPVQRPSWTYPGQELLRLAREARAEIEASGWFGRRNAS